MKRQRLELIDWTEQFPNETPLEIAIRQSTFCPCGKTKEIGERTCGGSHAEATSDALL